jgi:hypothetical protein
MHRIMTHKALIFRDDFLNNTQIPNFVVILPVGANLFNGKDVGTDGETE